MIGVYVFTNQINGKKYVGKSIDIDRRIYRHTTFREKNSLLKRALLKYGVNNFIIDKMECGKEDLEREEMRLISELNTRTPHGYNMTIGGEGMSGFSFSEEIKDKISHSLKEYYKNHPHPRSGTTHTATTKKIISEKKKGQFLGSHKTEEHRRKLSISNIGKHNRMHTEEEKIRQSMRMRDNNPNSKEFIFISPSGQSFSVIGSFSVFCKKNGLCADSMRKVLSRKQKQGHHKGWKVTASNGGKK